MAKIKDITNSRFGRITVVEYSHIQKRKAYWKCICDCGNNVVLAGTYLIHGKVKSCGCFRKETAKKMMLIHGLSDTMLFTVWQGIRARCYNHNHSAYTNYGGRGIAMCSEWRNDFKSFYDWAIANGWKKGLTIERKNNDGNYTPENCTIVTKKQQSRNRRNTFQYHQILTIRNLFKIGAFTRKELSQIYNRPYATIKHIINGRTWA